MRLRTRAVLFALAAALLSAPASAHAATAFAVRPPNELVRFDTSNPAAVTVVGAITGLGANETVRGIDFRPLDGQLYAATVATASTNNSLVKTYRIDPATGTATFVGQPAAITPGAGNVPAGYDFIPRIDEIRYVNSQDENIRLDPGDGSQVFGSNLTPAATTTIIATAYDRNVPGALATQYNIDRANSALTVQGGQDGDSGQQADFPNASLGFTLNQTADGGFDITREGTAYAALVDDGDDLARLYTVNLATGAATSVGLIGSGATEVRSLSILPDLDGDGVLDPSDNCLGTRNGDQANLDNDAEGDACDSDDDGDGVPDAVEAQIGSNPRAIDSDGDVKPDGSDACPTVAAATATGCPELSSGPLELALGPVPAQISLRMLRERGIAFLLTPSRPARFVIQLVGRARGARIAAAGDIVLGEARLSLGEGTRPARVRVARAQRRRLRRRARLQLRVTGTDALGITATATRRLRIR